MIKWVLIVIWSFPHAYNAVFRLTNAKAKRQTGRVNTRAYFYKVVVVHPSEENNGQK